MRFGYSSFSADLSSPPDRFRFGGFLRARGLEWHAAKQRVDVDAIVLSIAADLSAWSRLPKGGPPIVFDIVDPYVFTPRGGLGDRLRGLGKRLTGDFAHLEPSYRDVLDRMLARADAVVVGSEAIKAYAERFCPNVRVILDDHTGTVRDVKGDFRRGDGLELVWEGMLGNVEAFGDILPAVGRADARFHIVTLLDSPRFLRRYGHVRATEVVGRVFASDRGERFSFKGRRAELYAWSLPTFSRIFTAADVALIPMRADAYTLAKSASKLLLAARHGMPILCAATPAYEAFAEGAGVPMVCRTLDEWRVKLAALADDEAMRRDWGTKVRAYAESAYSSAALQAQWAATLASVGVVA